MKFEKRNIGGKNCKLFVYDAEVGTNRFRVMNAQEIDHSLTNPSWYVMQSTGYQFQRMVGIPNFATLGESKKALRDNLNKTS
jgi:hypothetical protein